MLLKAINGATKDEILAEPNLFFESTGIIDIAEGAYKKKSIDEIKGGGYVVKSLPDYPQSSAIS